MKRFVSIFLLICLLFVLTSCGKPQVTLKPQTAQMRNICELATMKCYYHNVAKVQKEDVQKILWFTKDMHFWIEYDGIVTVGIDASRVSMEINGTDVRITLPPAVILDCQVDSKSFTEDSLIIADNSVKVKATDQTEALRIAQKKMEEATATNTTLLGNAQEAAKSLLESYVYTIGRITGIDYNITWVYLDE